MPHRRIIGLTADSDMDWISHRGTKLLKSLDTSVSGGVDNETPVLYHNFSPRTDVWVRMIYRVDLSPINQWMYPVMVQFTEVNANPGYYGNRWQRPGISLNTADSVNQARPVAWNTTLDGSTTFEDATKTEGFDSVVYDMHLQYMGDILVGGQTRSQWYCELYQNDVLKYQVTYDLHIDAGKASWTSVNSLVIDNMHGSGSLTAAHPAIYIDDLSIGTTRGAKDIMANEGFDSGTFGLFTVDPGTMAKMTDTFKVIDDPTSLKTYNGHPIRVISGAKGSYSDDNTGVTPDTRYGNGIFYKWTAPKGGSVTIQTDSVGVSAPPDIKDTVLWGFNRWTKLVENIEFIVNDDNHAASYGGSNTYSLITFTAEAGRTYYFLVQGYDNVINKGTYKISWSM